MEDENLPTFPESPREKDGFVTGMVSLAPGYHQEMCQR